MQHYILPFVLALSLLIGIAACNTSNSNTDGNTSSTGSAATTTSSGDTGTTNTSTSTSSGGTGSTTSGTTTSDTTTGGTSSSTSDATSGSTSTSGSTTGSTTSGTTGGTTGSEGTDILTRWLINTTETATYIKDNGTNVLVNVQNASENSGHVTVNATGIPNYSMTAPQSLITWLNTRPKASSDFDNSTTSIQAGDTVLFGQDIGYVNGNNQDCDAGAGEGYWPPGPVCPRASSAKSSGYSFPQTASTTSESCKTGLGAVGLWVNGVSIYNWGDGTTHSNSRNGQSHQGDGVWQYMAPIAEVYDIDICLGHAAQYDYHHHGLPNCLKEQLGDSGTAHSPVYGFAADGYPIYGPYQASGQLAQSCWEPRDYSATSSTGCGSDGVRSCLLVDQYDINQGTVAVSANGPNVGASVTSQSSNPLIASDGFFFEDYYFDPACAAQGGAYLDQHNGHEHDDLGYHYHITVTEGSDGSLIDAFPYVIGPTFKGVLPSDSFTQCSTGQTRPPGGPPPGGGPPPNTTR